MAYTLFSLLVLSLAAGSLACEAPEVTSSVYSTSDGQLMKESVVIVEFSVQCKNQQAADMHLHAEILGSMMPVTKIPGEEKYQVSVADLHKAIPAGAYSVQVYDDEGATAYKKAQRAGEPTAAVASIFSVPLDHKGAAGGLNINTEMVAAAVAAFVFYCAYTAKAKMQD